MPNRDQSSPEDVRRKCREKTARGNAFAAKADAKRAASAHARRVGAPMNWFRCGCCGRYHVGSGGTAKQRAARKAAGRGGGG